MERWPGFRREEWDRQRLHHRAPSRTGRRAPDGPPDGNPQVPDTLRDKDRRPGRAGNRQYPQPQLIQPRQEARIAT
jgi:hypothetical protein